jgi:5-bromo-4-chloroindolyl phosphate hydrolysis protein
MMKSLEDISIGHRIIITFCIILAILFALALFGYLTGGWNQAQGEANEQLYQGIPLNQRLIEIDKESLDNAYKEHLKLLWSNWLKDDVKVVHRINEGLRRARHAYAVAAERIEERERQLK